jgi:hypothetical protein
LLFVPELTTFNAMKTTTRILFSVLSFLLLFWGTGCATSFQGIRFRSQDPPIDEAYRKLSLAMTVDGYTMAAAEPGKHTAETAWKDLKANERTDEERRLPGGTGSVQGRLLLRLEKRGMLYDVFFIPMIRAGADTTGAPAAVRHPLREKWEKALNALLVKEAKEED